MSCQVNNDLRNLEGNIMSVFNLVSTRNAGTAKQYVNSVVEGMDLPVREGTHKYWLAVAIHSFDKAETFTLKELGEKAVKLGLVIKKDGAKADGPYLASYYKKWLVTMKLMVEKVAA